MAITKGIKDFFKSESQKKAENLQEKRKKNDEANFRVFEAKKTLTNEVDRLKKEKEKLVKKLDSLTEGTKKHDDAVKEFRDVNNSLKTCEKGLEIINDTEADLLNKNKGGTLPSSVNVDNIVTAAMQAILVVIENSEEGSIEVVMTATERNRIMYEIDKARTERQGTSTEDRDVSEWGRTKNAKEDEMDEDDYEDTLDEIEATRNEMNEKSRQRASDRATLRRERNSDANKEIEEELAKAKSDREKLESESND